jgi:hypothetical protein
MSLNFHTSTHPTIVFPAYPPNFPEVDYDYREEKTTAELLRFNTSVVDHDELIGGLFHMNHPPRYLSNGVIYRGWMLKPQQYEFLYNSIYPNRGEYLHGYSDERKSDPYEIQWERGELIVSPKQYRLCHHFPNVYPYIQEHTGAAWWILENENLIQSTEKILSEARSMEISTLLLKDFVKSEKHDPRLFFINASMSTEHLVEILEEFKKARGNLFDSGFVLKQQKPLKLYENTKANEWRAFILFGQIVSLCPNSNQPDFCPPPDREFVLHVSSKIKSNFVTIDFAEDIHENWFVLETGDGQVSGLSPTQNILEFYNNGNRFDRELLKMDEEV